MSVCTRFAPSPTGFLHIGGARTALFSWLFAKKSGGKFVLRIEDTDRERSTQASVDAILEGMDWLGLSHDEGPYYQTERFARYEAVIQQLLVSGQAYRCSCSKERLDKLREDQMANKEKPRYDGHCRETTVSADEPHVIRFKNPASGEVIIEDLVYGPIRIQNTELDDLVIARQDGTPTYNLTVVVDDWDMGITHVIRGDDHINNTPRQINILKALDAKLPQYAHIPMILGEEGKRLSKRHGATGVMQYRDAGYLPEAVLNYLVRLGWSHGDDEIFSMDEMIAKFDLKSVNKSPAAINCDKLDWLNQHYQKTLPRELVAERLAWHFRAEGIELSNGPALSDIVRLQAERTKTLKEMAEKSRFFFDEVNGYEEKARKHLKKEVLSALNTCTESLSALEDWQEEAIHAVIVATAEQYELKLGKLAQPIRVALTGGTVSPPIDATLRFVGKERALERLRRVMTYIENS